MMSHHAEEEEQHLATLDELEATQEQITSYQGLLKDLPEIYERKFNERLKPFLDRNQQLIDEREQLLGRLQHGLPPAEPGKMMLLSSAASPVQGEPSHLTQPVLGRHWWLVALALLGLAFGMQLSRQLIPGPKKPASAVSLLTPRQFFVRGVQQRPSYQAKGKPSQTGFPSTLRSGGWLTGMRT